MKVFNNNLKKIIRTINLNPKLTDVHNIKYLPAFSKEWKNIIYSFNKNNLKNLAANTLNINKIIKSYFNLYFKNRDYLGKTKFVYLKKRRNFLRRIYVSDADIKYTTNKAKITLYTINKEKKALKKKYDKLKARVTFNLFKSYTFLYNSYIKSIHVYLKERFNSNLALTNDFVEKKGYTKQKLNDIRSFVRLNSLVLKKIWTILIKDQSNKYWSYLRKYDLLYSLNQFKFNQSRLLSKLTYLLQLIIGKKLEFSIINLKSIAYHPDIFTDILTLKIKGNLFSPAPKMRGILHKANIIKKNRIQERSKAQKYDKIDAFRNKYRDLKIVSHINQNGLSKLLNNIFDNKNYENNTKNIHNRIFHSISYKNLSGIRLKVSGRLTKRYRADRAVQTLKWKGGLKNIDSSFKGLSAVAFRGNNNSNVSYSWSKSKRRIGSFAVKGWIGGK